MAGGWTEWGKENIKGQGMIYRKLKNYARRKIQSLIDLRLLSYSQELDQRFAQNQQEIGTCRQELEQRDARNREELKKYAWELETGIRNCREEIRKTSPVSGVCRSGYCEADVMDDPAARECVSAIRNGMDIDQNMHQLGMEVEKEIHNRQKQIRTDSLVVLCSGLKKMQKYEAIRAEAYQIYLLLKRSTQFHIRLLSIESQQEESEDADADIAYVTESRLETYLSRIKTRLIIALEATAGFAHRANGLFFKYPVLLRLSAQNPLEGLSEQGIRAMLHLNDLGIHHYMVFSEHARKVLEQAGFKQVTRSLPLIDWKKIALRSSASEKNKRMIVGFASSPMEEQQSEDRGILLLGELIRRLPEFDFLILWREKAVRVPDSFMSDNCRIIYGVYDMKRFYSQIDCLLVPYSSENKNHACPVSALEAMLSEIPVVCTSCSGIAELVESLDMGYVCSPDARELSKALRVVREHGKQQCFGNKKELLAAKVGSFAFVEETLRIARRYVPEEIVTLGEWSDRLETAGKHLVQGREEIREYYSRTETAGNYHKERFIQFPHNCIDLLERKAVSAMIRDKIGSKQADLLDIAPGDGRIVQEALNFGHCTAADASAAMLDVLQKRFAGNDRLHVIQADYFEDTIEEKYDIVTTFRYIRHFGYADRKVLYKKIRSNLKENGMLVFDVPNIAFEMKQRTITGWENYNIYDMFWTKEDMVRELDENGFFTEYVIATGTGLMDNMPDAYQKEPVSWTFGAVRK